MSFIDLTGQRFNRLTVICRAPKPEGSKSTSVFWLCRCDCGNEKIISSNVLRQGKAQSCGCYNRDSHANKYKDLLGQQFGELVVIEKVPRPEHLKSAGAYWKCKCSCGNEIIVTGHSLLQGKSKSCGKCRTNTVDDLTGQVFDQLTVIERDLSRPSNWNGAFWKCKCSCGNMITVLGKNLKHQTHHSCGCINSYGERNIRSILEKNNIIFQSQYTYPDLLGPGGNMLRFDFAILNDNRQVLRLIEFQGEQHYLNDDEVSYWGDSPRENDKTKQKYCKEHNIILICIPYWKRDTMTIDDLLGDKYRINNEVV